MERATHQDGFPTLQLGACRGPKPVAQASTWLPSAWPLLSKASPKAACVWPPPMCAIPSAVPCHAAPCERAHACHTLALCMFGGAYLGRAVEKLSVLGAIAAGSGAATVCLLLSLFLLSGGVAGRLLLLALASSSGGAVGGGGALAGALLPSVIRSGRGGSSLGSWLGGRSILRLQESLSRGEAAACWNAIAAAASRRSRGGGGAAGRRPTHLGLIGHLGSSVHRRHTSLFATHDSPVARSESVDNARRQRSTHGPGLPPLQRERTHHNADNPSTTGERREAEALVGGRCPAGADGGPFPPSVPSTHTVVYMSTRGGRWRPLRA